MSGVKKWQYWVAGIVSLIMFAVIGEVTTMVLKLELVRVFAGGLVGGIAAGMLFSVLEDVFLMHNLEKEERENGKDQG